MHEINLQDAGTVGGGWSFGGWVFSQAVTFAAGYTWDAVRSGQVDYAGVAESSGTYYNMMGA